MGVRLASPALQNRTADRQLQKIRLSSDRTNLLSRSRNQRADGDGFVEFAPDAGVARLEDMTVERSEAGIVRIIEGSNP